MLRLLIILVVAWHLAGTYFKLPKNTQVSKKGLSIYYSLVTSFTILFIVYLIPVLVKIVKV